MLDKDSKANEAYELSGDSEQTPEAKAVAADDSEIAKLTADLAELRNTLLRRQADFENYRKRIEKERAEDQKRATARLIDPHLHQAMDRLETDEHKDNQIVQVYQPGYVYHGRVLRPAMVRVAVHATPASKKTVN